MSFTTIIWDEVLMNEIVSFRKLYVNPYKLNSKTYSFKQIDNIQNNIRDYMNKYLINNINFSSHNNKISKNNYYALFVLLLFKDPRVFNSWDELTSIVYEHTSLDGDYFFNEKYNLKIKKEDYNTEQDLLTCCCSQNNCSVNKMGLISSDDCCFIVGSICINKLGIKFSSYCNKINYKAIKLNDPIWCELQLAKEQKKLEKQQKCKKEVDEQESISIQMYLKNVKDKNSIKNDQQKHRALNDPVKFGKYKDEYSIVEIAEFDKKYLFYLCYHLDFFGNEEYINNTYITEYINSLE
jgi:hypothetical protein